MKKIRSKIRAALKRHRPMYTRSIGRLKPDLPQVFCIGFHKTCTTSLGKAFKILDYRAIHGDGLGLWSGSDEGRGFIAKIDAGDYALDTLPLFDAFLDNPYFSIWRQLAERHPEAQFILTIRDENEWIDSCVRYYRGRRVRPMRRWMFEADADPSSSDEARARWLDAYRKHNAEILEHFSLQLNFLVMDITKGDGWEKLCSFLGSEIPKSPFPFLNKSKT